MTTACPRCGHDNADDALLCATCRAYLGWTRRPAPGDGPAPATPPPAAPSATPPPPAATRPGPAADAPPARPARSVAPPAPIAVPRDRAGAPRAIQVQATTPPRSATGPARPAPVRDTPPARGTSPTPDGSDRERTGRSTWSPTPSPATGAPATAGADRPDLPGTTAPDPAPGPGSTRSPGPAATPVQVVLGPSTPRPARPAARSTPARTIGVRVAAGPARIDPQRPVGPDTAQPARTSSFEALQPTAVGDDPAGTARGAPAHGADTARAAGGGAVGDAGGVPVFEEAVRCPSCRRALPVSRRFCRCGATLARPAARVDDDAPEPTPWYRRAAGSATSFRRRARAANHGVRVVFDRGRAGQVHVARATAALAAVGLAGVVVLPQASDVRDRAYAAVQQVDPRGYTRVAGVTATTDPPPDAADPAAAAPADPTAPPADPASAPADPAAAPADPATAPADVVFGPQNAVDGATGRAWSVPWVPPVDAGPPCQRPGGAPALVLTLPTATDVDRVGLVAGLPESAPDRARQAVPSLVDVTWLPSGRCTTIDLTDAAALQTQDVADVRGATSARVVVVDVHLPQDPPADLRVALAEVVVMTHGRLGVG